MNARWPSPRTWLLVLVPIVAITVPPGTEAGPVQSESCRVPTRHAGIIFPVDQVSSSWACRLQPIMTNYTTANTIGPVRTPLPEDIYRYFLDHASVAAALVNRLDLGLYKAIMQGPGRFWGSDGEGTEGLVQLVYEDRTSRVYYLEGVHDGTLLPAVAGKAVVLLKMRPITETQGPVMTETTVVSYTQLNSRILSGLMSLIRPLAGKVVVRQFMKGFETADRLSQVMRRDPERVLFEATDPPALSDEDVAFLKQALSDLHHADRAINRAATSR